MPHVVERPGRRVHPRPDHRLVEVEIRCARAALIQIHGELELIDVKHTVHVVHVFLEQLLGCGRGQDGFERRRLAQRDLDRAEAAPGDAEHAHLAVRPRLAREPGDDLLRILLLLRRVFALGRHSFAVAEAANVHPSADEPALGEIRVLTVIADRLVVVLSIRQVFEERRKSIGLFAARRHVERRREPHPVAHRNPSLLDLDAIARRRGRQRRCGRRGGRRRPAGGRHGRRRHCGGRHCCAQDQKDAPQHGRGGRCVRGPRCPRMPSHQP